MCLGCIKNRFGFEKIWNLRVFDQAKLEKKNPDIM